MTIHRRGARMRASLLAGAVALALSCSVQAKDFTFEIGAGDLKSALEAYAKQSGQQLVYQPADVQGRKSPGVHGSMSQEKALEALLAGTGLTVRKDSSGAIAIFPAEAVAGGASTKKAGGEQELEEIVVTATAISHVYLTSRSVTRIDADPMQLPMSISAVQDDLLRAQQARSVTDALNNVSGMEVTADDAVYTRGFVASPARNGTVALNELIGNTRGRPVIATQRIEVVKGPAQIMQGSASGYGGTVNIITKVPEATPTANVGLGLGSDEYWRIDADLNGTLVDGQYGRLMGRAIGSVQDQGDTVVGYRGASDDFASAGLRWVNDDWGSDVSLVYEYNDSWSPAPATVVTTGKRFGSDLKQFNFGENGVDYGNRGTDNTIDFNFTQTLNADWKLAINYVWKDTEGGGATAYTYYNPYNPFADPDYVDAYTSNFKGVESVYGDTSNYLKVSLYGKVDTGPVSHHLLFAYDYSDSDGRADPAPGDGPYCTTNITNWTKECFPPDPDFRIFTARSTYDVTDSGVLLSDRLQWDKWSALLGVRWLSLSRRDVIGDTMYGPDYTEPGYVFRESTDQTLPQYGFVYEATPDLSLYASGNEGFRSNASNRDENGRPLPNQTSTQYEMGVKSLLLDRQIVVTLALYQINQKNVALALDVEPPPGQQAVYVTIDGIRSEGVELEISGQPLRGLQLRANYAYLDTEAETKGRPLSYGYTPNKFNLWAEYWFGREVGSGWWAGGGLNYNSAPTPALEFQPFQGLNPPVTVIWPTFPSSTLVNLSAGWSKEHWSAIAGVKNVMDERVYNLPAVSNFVATAAEGRTYAFDVSYRF